MKIFDAIKRWWRNYSEKLEKSNSELFGSDRADCCSLNKKQK